MGRGANIGALALSAALLGSVASPVSAGMRIGNSQVDLSLGVRAVLHHDGLGRSELAQQRNEIRLGFVHRFYDYGEEAFGLREANLSLLWRARFDLVFDLRDRYGDLGYRRDDFRFPEGKLPREFFVDLRFTGFLSPLSLRVGKQQLVWGEADLFRSIDVINPLRLDQNGLVGEDLDDYREPLWIARFLWNVGNLGPFSQVGVEWFYSANGRPLTHRAIVGEEFRIKFASPLDGPNPRPNQSPFHRVRHPWEITRDGPYATEIFDQADLGDTLGNVDLIYLNDDRYPKRSFDVDASMAGIRILASGIAGVDLSFNYVFKRVDLPSNPVNFIDVFDPAIADDGSPNARPNLLADAFAAEATPDDNGDGIPDGRAALIDRCLGQYEPLIIGSSLRGYPGNRLTACLVKAFDYPWTHVFGVTATYNDFEYTGMIFRMEQSFSTKEARSAMRPAAGNRAGEFPTARDFATELRRETQVWRSMLGFDWLRAFPWMPITRNDPWFITVQLLNEYYSHTKGHMGQAGSITDRQSHWNPLATALATGFFLNSRFRPTLAAGWDASVNFPFLWLQAEYHLSKRWTVRFGDILYLGSGSRESFVFLNRYADRDTLFLQITHHLL